MKSTFPRWSLLATTGMLVLSGVHASEPVDVGFVYSSEGEWLQNGKKLAGGSGAPIYAGSTIALDQAYKADHSGSGSIVILLYDGERIERHSSKAGELDDPVRIPSLNEQSSGWDRFRAAIGALFTKQPKRYTITVVRGITDIQLDDGVAQVQGGSIDLANLFANVPPGEYKVRLRRIFSAEITSPTSAPLQQTIIKKSAPGIIGYNPTGVVPGLWQAEVVATDTDEDPATGTAWLLVCAPDNYREQSRAFEHAKALAMAWTRSSSPAEKHTILHLVLDGLQHESREP